MPCRTKDDFKVLFDQAVNDEERWGYVRENQHLNPMVFLDNDDTFVSFDEDEWVGHFDFYVGWHDGIKHLLDAVGIEAEEV